MDKEEKSIDRRSFITKIVFGGGLLASAVLMLKHGFSFIYPTEKPVSQRKLLVGRVNELEIGEAKEFQIEDKTLFLVRTENGYKVLSAICTHLGCKIKWESYRNRFYCACHQGIFSADGEVIGGPPPRRLDEYRVEVDKNLVYMYIEDENGGTA